MDQVITYFTTDPMRLLYFIGGSGGLWFWVKEWRNRTRVKIRLISEIYETASSPYISVETTMEITNLGSTATSVEPNIKVSSITPERESMQFTMQATDSDRSLSPHHPTQIKYKAECDARFAFTWYRTYSVTLSKGPDTALRTLNTSNMHISALKCHVGSFLLKLFSWLPGNA